MFECLHRRCSTETVAVKYALILLAKQSRTEQGKNGVAGKRTNRPSNPSEERRTRQHPDERDDGLARKLAHSDENFLDSCFPFSRELLTSPTSGYYLRSIAQPTDQPTGKFPFHRLVTSSIRATAHNDGFRCSAAPLPLNLNLLDSPSELDSTESHNSRGSSFENANQNLSRTNWQRIEPVVLIELGNLFLTN